MKAKHIYPHCPSCKGEGEYLLAGKMWPCTWCNIEYEREICEHDFRFNDSIPFAEKRFFFCFVDPLISDFEVCVKCGKWGQVLRGTEPIGKGCCR